MAATDSTIPGPPVWEQLKTAPFKHFGIPGIRANGDIVIATQHEVYTYDINADEYSLFISFPDSYCPGHQTVALDRDNDILYVLSYYMQVLLKIDLSTKHCTLFPNCLPDGFETRDGRRPVSLVIDGLLHVVCGHSSHRITCHFIFESEAKLFRTHATIDNTVALGGPNLLYDRKGNQLLLLAGRAKNNDHM